MNIMRSPSIGNYDRFPTKQANPLSPISTLDNTSHQQPAQWGSPRNPALRSMGNSEKKDKEIVFPGNDDSDITAMYMQSLKRGEDWSFENFKTIVNWLNLASLYLVLLDYSIEYYTQVINSVTLWGILVSTLTTTVSISQFAVNDRDEPTLSFWLKVFFTVMSFITAGLTAAIKVLRAKEHLETAIYAHTKWMKFATELSSQLQLPIQIRTNAIKIIINYKDVFKELFTLKVSIPNSVKRHVAYILEVDAQNEQTISKLASGELASMKTDDTHTPPGLRSGGFHTGEDGERDRSDELETPMCGDPSGCLCGCNPHPQSPRHRKSYNTVANPMSSVPTSEDLQGQIQVLTTKQLNHIFGASRLNLYFIFKDLLSNEIRAFEYHMREHLMLMEHQYIMFTITPSRIFMHIIEMTQPARPPSSLARPPPFRRRMETDATFQEEDGEENHDAEQNPNHSPLMNPMAVPSEYVGMTLQRFTELQENQQTMLSKVTSELDRIENRMTRELETMLSTQRDDTKSYMDALITRLQDVVSKSPLLESTSEAMKSTFQHIVSGGSATDVQGLYEEESDDSASGDDKGERTDGIVREIQRQNALNESEAKRQVAPASRSSVPPLETES